MFTLVDFKSSVRLNYRFEDNGARTIAWLQRKVARRDKRSPASIPNRRRSWTISPHSSVGSGWRPKRPISICSGTRWWTTWWWCRWKPYAKTASDDCSANHCLEKGGRGAEKRNEQLHQYPAIDPGRTARQRELSGLPSFKRLYRDIERYMVRTIWRMKQQGEVPASERFFRSSAAFGDGKRAFGTTKNAKN